MIFASEGNVTNELLDFHLVGPITAHQFLLIFCGVLMVGLFGWAARKMPVTPKKTGLLALLEFGLVWVRDEVVYAWLGPEEGRRYLPLMWTIFFFILFSNLFGLFPFTVVPFGRTDALSVATGNLAVTGAMAFIVFVVVLMAGFRKHGIGGYWGTLVPDGVPMAARPDHLPARGHRPADPGVRPRHPSLRQHARRARAAWGSCSASSSGSTSSPIPGSRSCPRSARRCS